MNYEDLRRYQRMERNSPVMAELNDSFYTDLSTLIKEQKQKYAGSSSAEDLKVLENTLKVSRDLFERREQKILLKSLRSVKTKEFQENNLVQQEKQLFTRLLDILKENRTDFESILIGNHFVKQQPVSKPEIVPKQEKVLEEKIEKIASNNVEEKTEQKPVEIPVKKKSEPLNMVLVRILTSIPKFVTSNLKEYGPFQTNEITRIPKKESELLSNKGLVEEI